MWHEIPPQHRRGEMMAPTANTRTVIRYGPDDVALAKRRKRVARTLTSLVIATAGLILFILVMGDLRLNEAAFARAEVYIDQVTQRMEQPHVLPLNLAFRVDEELGESTAARRKFEWLTRKESWLMRGSDRRVLVAHTDPIQRRLMADGRVIVFFEKGVFGSEWVSLEVFDRLVAEQIEELERLAREDAATTAILDDPTP